MTNDERPAWEGFCIIEQLGHRRLAGYISPIEIQGVGMIRLDLPGDGPTVYIHPQTVYAITPTTEEIAIEIARQAPAPVSRWDLRRLLPEPAPGPTGIVYPTRDDDEDEEAVYDDRPF